MTSVFYKMIAASYFIGCVIQMQSRIHLFGGKTGEYDIMK